ncbi:MAG: hypothetical protein JSR76_00480 [Verrucomicrobia bacterium]|nr:hypothetical protein [Verrucomicrobiota bacterium]
MIRAACITPLLHLGSVAKEAAVNFYQSEKSTKAKIVGIAAAAISAPYFLGAYNALGGAALLYTAGPRVCRFVGSMIPEGTRAKVEELSGRTLEIVKAKWSFGKKEAKAPPQQEAPREVVTPPPVQALPPVPPPLAQPLPPAEIIIPRSGPPVAERTVTVWTTVKKSFSIFAFKSGRGWQQFIRTLALWLVGFSTGCIGFPVIAAINGLRQRWADKKTVKDVGAI